MVTTHSMAHVAEAPFHAYEGDDPFVFVSYAHDDAHSVFPDLKKFRDEGLNIWYDQGISPGSEWTEEVAEALENCSFFVTFISSNSVNSINVRNEINLAIADNKPFLAIYLEDVELPPGLKLSIGSLQAILKYSMNEEEYMFRCRKAFKKVPELYNKSSSEEVPVKKKTAEIENIKVKDDSDSNHNVFFKKYSTLIIISFVAILLLAIVGFVSLGGGNSSSQMIAIEDFSKEDSAHDYWNYNYKVYGEISGFQEDEKLYTVHSDFYDSSNSLMGDDEKEYTGAEINGNYLLGSFYTDYSDIERVVVEVRDSDSNVLATNESTLF